MKYFNLYKKGGYGWFHVTSFKFNNLKEAVNFYKKEWNIKIGNELGKYKVTGL
jgi:hypothetical protein